MNTYLKNILDQQKVKYDQSTFIDQIKQLSEKTSPSEILSSTEQMNTFQKNDLMVALKGRFTKADAAALITFLDKEAEQVYGREEATAHLTLKEQIVSALTETVGIPPLDPDTLLHHHKIKALVAELKNKHNS